MALLEAAEAAAAQIEAEEAAAQREVRKCSAARRLYQHQKEKREQVKADPDTYPVRPIHAPPLFPSSSHAQSMASFRGMGSEQDATQAAAENVIQAAAEDLAEAAAEDLGRASIDVPVYGLGKDPRDSNFGQGSRGSLDSADSFLPWEDLVVPYAQLQAPGPFPPTVSCQATLVPIPRFPP